MENTLPATSTEMTKLPLIKKKLTLSIRKCNISRNKLKQAFSVPCKTLRLKKIYSNCFEKRKSAVLGAFCKGILLQFMVDIV